MNTARRKWWCAVWALALVFVLAGSLQAQERELYPPMEPFEAGHFKVSDIHEIYYQVCGNPKGKPVIVLHGGPGFGCYPRLRQYFNPEKFMVVLHDQRGCARSRPAGELRENTTQELVADIERLREHLKIEGKALVFGGSWGSTLALTYAEAHPEHVSGMVLRGIFTGTAAELEHIYGNDGLRRYFPDAVDWVEAVMPAGSTGFDEQSLYRVFTSDDLALKQKVAEAWIRFAIKTEKMHASDDEVAAGLGDYPYDVMAGAKIDCQYAVKRFFLEDGQLLRDAHRLKDIPITLINGRYDMLCPPITAYRLHRMLPKSKLVIVEAAGHSESEPGTTQALLQAVAEFE
jgi:proline iminopeptidase